MIPKMNLYTKTAISYRHTSFIVIDVVQVSFGVRGGSSIQRSVVWVIYIPPGQDRTATLNYS